MRKFALLSETELRLVDVILEAGTFAELPAAVRPSDDAKPGGRRFRFLAPWGPLVESTARRVGDGVQHGSIRELLHIRDAALSAGAGPATGRARS